MRGSGSGQWLGNVRKSPVVLMNSAAPPISWGFTGKRRSAGSRASRASIYCSPSSGSSEHTQ
jgi:hypothetical protein